MNDDTLIQMLREEAPVARPEFIASLDKRVELGFRAPRHSAHSATSPTRFTRAVERLREFVQYRPVGMSLAAGTCVLVLIAVTVGPTLTKQVDEPSAVDKGATAAEAYSGGGSDVSVTASAPEVDAVAPDTEALGRMQDQGITNKSSVQPASAAAGATAVAESDRQHILGVGMFLTVEPKQVPDAVAKSVKVAEGLGGYVADSSYNVTGDSAVGTAELWVPTKQNAVAMARLAKLGTVERTTQGSQDVTATRADNERLLAEARAKLDQLSPKAAKAQREALERQVAAREQRLANLDDRIAMSRIAFTVTGKHTPKVEQPLEPWTFDWATDKVSTIFRHMAAGAIVFGAVLLVPALLVAGIWFALTTRRRRLRERTLDDE